LGTIINQLGEEDCATIQTLSQRGGWNEFQHSPQRSGFDFNKDCHTCSPAIYSHETRQLELPEVEIPLFADVNGKPLAMTGLYEATLEIPFGFADFEVTNFLAILPSSVPCHATFEVDTGLLNIPLVQVTTLAPVLQQSLVWGPLVNCRVTLQQSVLRPEVLMLYVGCRRSEV